MNDVVHYSKTESVAMGSLSTVPALDVRASHFVFRKKSVDASTMTGAGNRRWRNQYDHPTPGHPTSGAE